MTWQPEIEELNRRRKMAEAMGGPEKVKRQHDGGRLTVRERVLKLVDKNSFHEVGAIAGRGEYDAKGDLVTLTPSNCVMGRAEIDGRPVVVLGDDFTVRGGSADATIAEAAATGLSRTLLVYDAYNEVLELAASNPYAQRVIDMALQMHGGRGVEVGTKVEALYRDIRALRIYEGASEVQLLIMGKSVLKGVST